MNPCGKSLAEGWQLLMEPGKPEEQNFGQGERPCGAAEVSLIGHEGEDT